MPAWIQTASWTTAHYQDYRDFVKKDASSYRWRTEDCADLSMIALIDFAAARGLPLTFTDMHRGIYPSIGHEALFNNDFRFSPRFYHWHTKDAFTEAVTDGVGVGSLWKYNTVVNKDGPMPGDLMMKFTTGRRAYHHASLVFGVYPPGQSHTKQNDRSVLNYPGDDDAEDQYWTTEYFKGTLGSDEKTASRLPDKDTHIDYLNHRGHKKPLAELIYFANARQFQDEGFEFRMYSPWVLAGDDYHLPESVK